MTVLNLGACDKLVGELRQANLLPSDQLQEALHEVSQFLTERPDARPDAVAGHLVARGLLSDYQAETLLQGKAAELVLREYVLVEPVGPGVVGTVYRGVCRTNGQPVDVEVLRQKSKWNTFAAFRQKKAFADIDHPAVVPFADVGTGSGVLYLVWPRTDGESLDVLVGRSGPLAPARAVDLAAQVGEGLWACHERGVFHGLLNPTSIVLPLDGGVRVRHFGIGGLMADQQAESLLNTRATAQALDVGLECASLETAIDPRDRDALSDQHSLAAVTYYALTGRYPFPESNPMKKIVAMKGSQPTPLRLLNPAVSERLASVLARMMGKQRADRYPSMAEAVQALRDTLRAKEAPPAPAAPKPFVLAAPSPAPTKPVTEDAGGRGHTAVLIGFVVAVLAVAAAGVVWALR